MTNPTAVLCPHCCQPSALPPGALGQVVGCPFCGQMFATPAAAPPAPPPPPRVPEKKPAASPSEAWFVQQDGKQSGPYPHKVLKKLAANGDLRADAWLILAGTDASVLAATVPGLLFRPKRTRAGQRPTTAAARPSSATPPPRALKPAATVPVPAPQSVKVSPPAPPRVPQPVKAPPPAPPKPETVVCDCPSCDSKCVVPRPRVPTMYSCPRCKQPFRAAVTSVGVVAQRVAAPVPAR